MLRCVCVCVLRWCIMAKFPKWIEFFFAWRLSPRTTGQLHFNRLSQDSGIAYGKKTMPMTCYSTLIEKCVYLVLQFSSYSELFVKSRRF